MANEKNGAKPQDEKDEKDGKKPPFLKGGGVPGGLEASMDKSDDGDADDKKDEDKMDKSLITEEDLIKSVTKLEGVVQGSATGRRQELLKKALSGKLSDEEGAELAKSLTGASDKSLTEEIEKSLAADANEEFAKAFDGSKYLAEFHKSFVDNLTSVSLAFEKSDARRDEQSVVLAKAISDLTKAQIQQMRMLKSVQQRLGIIAQQPARAPKAATTEAMAKSQAERIGGGQPTGSLSPVDVLDTLEAMFAKSMENGGEGIAVTGEKYEEAISKFEQTNQIHPALLSEVVRFRRAAAGR